MRWFGRVLDEVFQSGSAKVMLADDLIGEFYLGEDGFLHWRRCDECLRQDDTGGAGGKA